LQYYSAQIPFYLWNPEPVKERAENVVQMWLSVDPMSDVHPDFSPYAYCFNNPVNFVDPWGLDTVLFNKNGQFGKPIPGGDESTDTYVRVSDKEFESNKINYNKKGELRDRHKNMQIDKSFREGMERKESSYIYHSDGYEKSKEIFEFFAKNTKVEWAQLIYKDLSSGDVKTEISTDHNPTEVYFHHPYDLKKGSYTLVDVRHSHPEGFVSPQDRSTHWRLNIVRPVNAYVLKYGKYYQYGSERSSDERYPVDAPQSY
ncbi:MAG: hypothetical protein CVU11_14745, partial [Bacteroidetes bacterium HGW-Bacteroidetes-6]